MSLADQQWCPTSVQVTVLQARGLRIKGKSGTNDAYAVMQVGKEKFQTSVAEKSVAPMWKEEAAFDLPPLHHGAHGSERSTLHVHVLHRALVGPDKLLGQAVINLLQLSEDKTRSKTEWFKLLDKAGKPDKDRGEVLLDIQFMRNNMTASMFDLSAAGKSRSRLGKFKDKVRGKKKESDSGSGTTPSFTQVLTDSEEEANGDEVAASKDGKKKHKIKSLFSPKSNLQKNMSQSMSVLPAKNSTLSGSQSSGLNVDSSEGKKKFKFKIHKRSGSSDSKDSSSGQQKQAPVEQSNLCINGSHIYCEEPPTRTSRIGSNFSLASSGHGSMEEVPENSPPSVDSLRAARQCSPWTEEEEEEEEVENIKEDELRREEGERMEEERRRREEEELESPAEATSTNPFDENYSYNPFEEIPDSPPGAKEANVQQRCQSSGSRIVSADEQELIGAQREKRPAPQPPGRNQAEKPSQREQDASARHLGQINKQNKDKDVKTVSVPPQRSVQMIVPLSRPAADSKGAQGSAQSNAAKGAAVAGKHNKRPAPPRPPSVEEEPKTSSTAETKQTVYGLNPFEDDEDENTDDADPVCPPPSHAADKDAASQARIKSSKVARAPAPPKNDDTLTNQGGGCVTDDPVPADVTNQACDPQLEAVDPVQVQESPVQQPQPVQVQTTVEAGVKKEGPPTAARRLQPVKPLNSVEQQSVSAVQAENKPTGIQSEDKAKVNDGGLKGPYSQLTQQELISLVLKQENQLSERDKKISELELYIDNLLVRVIEEQPSILMSLNAVKKAA
ncbi:rab11 family-interacting protein 2-like [Stegastes partitus]|uniref:Rab11 family-interacting protein 2-like n=1 Tax=Stegastes partitus TaxID=144197 RepID=A0A9Y4KCS0_9TELE|nr:PREDICTED: rab11 family-interacting protein 2-like [Stegastes partitus]